MISIVFFYVVKIHGKDVICKTCTLRTSSNWKTLAAWLSLELLWGLQRPTDLLARCKGKEMREL